MEKINEAGAAPEPTPCSICGELEYRCPVCGNQMPSRGGRFVHHTGGGGEWICRGSGEPLPAEDRPSSLGPAPKDSK
jgi:hypothetical protein